MTRTRLDTLTIDSLTSLASSQSLTPIRTETALRSAVAHLLRSHGIAVEEQVSCAAGVADLVTADRSAIFECKLLLHRRALLQAATQAQLYRQAINPAARAIVIGFTTPAVATLRAALAELQVEVVGIGSWPQPASELSTRATEIVTPALRFSFPTETEAPTPASFIPHPSSLRWNVAALAQTQGIANPARLALQLGVARQNVYAIWKGTAAQVTLDMIGLLARGLSADPGMWLTWSGEPFMSNLIWNIGPVAKARGLTPIQLSFKAMVHMSSIGPLYTGTAQAIAPATLARVALALDSADWPFAIGQLFAWEIAL